MTKKGTALIYGPRPRYRRDDMHPHCRCSFPRTIPEDREIRHGCLAEKYVLEASKSLSPLLPRAEKD